MKITFNIKGFTVNTFYKKFNNRIVISKEGLAWKNKIQRTLRFDSGIINPLEGRIGLNIWFYFKTHRVRDLDNLLKPFIDCMKGIVIKDDCQIEELYCKKIIDKRYEKIVLEIIELY
jgi:Holliday junction resolvase RusA-like endonuclease